MQMVMTMCEQINCIMYWLDTVIIRRLLIYDWLTWWIKITQKQVITVTKIERRFCLRITKRVKSSPTAVVKTTLKIYLRMKVYRLKGSK